jgi:hypothetical protein
MHLFQHNTYVKTGTGDLMRSPYRAQTGSTQHMNTKIEEYARTYTVDPEIFFAGKCHGFRVSVLVL